jgi:hypothetical protein
MVADLIERSAKLPATSLPAPRARPAPRRYHVPLTPIEVIDRLRGQAGVKARARGSMMADLGPSDAQFALEIAEHEFTVHCGSPVVRGQSALGNVRLMYLRGQLSETRDGTLIELSFGLRRPQWAMQRWIGFLALAGMGLAWVLVGPGVLATKAMMYGALMLVLAPVIVHELRRTDETADQRLALLNLVEHAFGPIQLDESHPDEPYRRRSLAAAPTGAELDDDYDAPESTPENT